MLKKIIYSSIAIAVVVAGYIGAQKLNFWPRSVRIFNYNSAQAFSGRMGRNQGGFEGRMGSRPGEDSQRPRIRQLPDSIRIRFEAQGGRPPMNRDHNFPDSLRQRFMRSNGGQPSQRNDGRVENFEERSRHGEFEGFGRGGGRGRSMDGRKINLRNVWWFLAVFSAFTVVTIYSEKIVKYAIKKFKKE